MKSNYDIKRALRLASEKHWETDDEPTDVDDIYDKGWTDALVFLAKELGLKF